MFIEQKKINTVCGYCSVGCNLTVFYENDKIIKVKPNSHYPVNKGKSCLKGAHFLKCLDLHNRAKTPSIKDLNGILKPVSWDTAFTSFVDNFKKIQEKHGKESIAVIGTGQITNEEIAFLGALAKFGMGVKHTDSNTRTCVASSAVAYKQSFGFDAPPYTYKDCEESDVMVFIGSNAVIAHPVLWQRVMMNKNKPEIIVIDPRKSITAGLSNVSHYAIKPQTDLILFYAVAKIIIENKWVDLDFINNNTNHFKEFAEHLTKFTIEDAAELTTIDKKQIYELAEKIHKGKRVSFWWMLGINQSNQAVRTVQSIINLALMTGNIGKPGTGANSITGQCNAMGSRLFNNASSLIGGYDFSNESHRSHVADVLKIDKTLIPNAAGVAYDEIIAKINRGEIKGLWIVGTNPVHTWINQKEITEAFEKLDYLVVQDMFMDTKTAQMANLFFPTSGCGEKIGTFINSERRFGLIQKVKEPPMEVFSDFEIFQKVSKYWGCEDIFKEWSSPEDVFFLLKKLLKNTPADISGICDYKMIEEYGGIQWPFLSSNFKTDECRLFEDGKFFHSDNKAKFIFDDYKNQHEPTSLEFPFVLISGRGSLIQWHTLTRTENIPAFKDKYPNEIYVEINIKDAEELNIKNDEWVFVSSQSGKIKAKAKLSETVKSLQIFIPMHYSEVNMLSKSVYDLYSRQPLYKYTTVNVKK